MQVCNAAQNIAFCKYVQLAQLTCSGKLGEFIKREEKEKCLFTSAECMRALQIRENAMRHQSLLPHSQLTQCNSSSLSKNLLRILD